MFVEFKFEFGADLFLSSKKRNKKEKEKEKEIENEKEQKAKKENKTEKIIYIDSLDEIEFYAKNLKGFKYLYDGKIYDENAKFVRNRE